MRGSDHGIVLFAALWLLVLLAVVSGGIIELVRAERRVARHIVAEAEARALAEAGIARGIEILLGRERSDPWPVDGTPRMVEHAGQRIELTIQDEIGRIDLNVAADDLLKGLLSSAGLREIEVEAHVDRILDWRDPDDLKQLHGAERADYAGRGVTYAPRNGAFESVDELGQVLGVTASLLERVRPALTVFSRRASVDAIVAPREALLALPGMDEAQARQTVAMRRHSPSPSRLGGASVSVSGTTAALAALGGRAFSLVGRAEGQGGVRVTRMAVVRFTGDPVHAYWILDWR